MLYATRIGVLNFDLSVFGYGQSIQIRTLALYLVIKLLIYVIRLKQRHILINPNPEGRNESTHGRGNWKGTCGLWLFIRKTLLSLVSFAIILKIMFSSGENKLLFIKFD